ncbi:unnamed protein product [Didymodactylos carnosus]|uniref:Calcineurin-like phosphoesterase domain-containing protein n=1 Tax=Didymodactylos carnosus TaxID=1234261 RepID=A0A814R4P1_9BILA|nr:unnamed protein product [Didymodactylos carnosus]CAF1127021.1 unnamed protein product [Didymodactylos carnosus]CAF3814144.1 unnamed protein product [Didymodactylos carnosus]CAF3890593.1 unnamed protein product [Didymodactylos carnosus]
MKQLKIYCISDTHQRHRELTDRLNDGGDILIHAGDFTNYGGRFSQKVGGIDDFNEWLGTLPFKHKVLIFGNHERVLSEDKDVTKIKQRFSNATYLNDECVEIDGLKVFGSSWKVDHGNNRDRLWATVPIGAHIVVTHNPPDGKQEAIDIDKSLMRRILQVKPVLTIFGHIHVDYGVWERDGVTFVNAAMMNDHQKTLNDPIGFRLEITDDKTVKLDRL